MVLERIKLPGKEIILVGTAHISEKSIELVKKTIEEENPEAIGVELDVQRFHQLKSGEQYRETNISEIIKTGKAYLFLINLLLSNLQRRIGVQLGVKPGSEMLTATDLAEEKGIKIYLLDRDVKITLKRAFKLMPFFEKIKLFSSIFFGFFSNQAEELTPEKIEELKNQDVMTKLMQELSETAPTIKQVLVDERDKFIAEKINQIQAKKIVAVVGAGHLQGIKNYLGKKINLNELEIIPKKKNMLKYIAYTVPIIFIALIGYAFFTKGITLSLKLFFWWFLITGGLSALGVIIARGHIFSAITAFIVAPFTTLHPAVASGWFAAIVEAKMSMPKVKDFEELYQINSFKDFSSNRVTRILLVTVMANLGSTIGTIIAFPYLIAILK